MGWRAWVSREECEEVGALGDSVEGGRVGERRDPGGQSWDLGMRKNWGLDKGRDGGPPGESSSFQGLFFFSRSRLLIQSSGCGGEIAPSFPRPPRLR